VLRPHTAGVVDDLPGQRPGSVLRGQIKSVSEQIQQLHETADTASEQTALINQQAVLSEQLTQMQVNTSGETGGLTVVTPAVTPGSPSSPKPTENGLLGLVAGLILGLAVAFLRESLDDTVATKKTAEEYGGTTVLTAVPMVECETRT
jgi:protein tyrosine kinase modulator